MSNDNKDEIIDNLSKILRLYEDERKKEIKKSVIKEFGMICAIVVLIYLVHFFDKLNNTVGPDLYSWLWFFSILGVLILSVLLFIFPGGYNKEFKLSIKQNCLKYILDVFNLKTMNGNPLEKDRILKESNLFPVFNESYYDDVIEGTFKGVKYSMYEVELRHVTSGKSQTNFEAFKGVVIEFPANKPVKAHTIITTKKDINKRNALPMNFILYGLFMIILACVFPAYVIFDELTRQESFGFSEIFQFRDILYYPIVLACIMLFCFIFIRGKNLKTAKLESINFDKEFVMQTEDQTEGRYLVTPAFMERMNNFRTAFGTKHLKCAFFNNKILFAIASKRDLFEVCSLYKRMGDKKLLLQFYNEINSIKNMIEYFKLNEKTGL